ncbi:hypothetical protein OH76DRAFT_1415429 [Lentinus brumalis]|uniref:Uncharacterized protein n=1 Tax=Lentinus brumalis TaxID=2498619 RepID=A0A371DQ75_9APHY|nr:hypothetical protein OH76DRAFT_1415429 [Polyporus brumalis]
MADGAPPVDPNLALAHLPPCPDCGFFLSAPILCKGWKTPEYDGLWFHKCFHNFEPVDTTCKHFAWTKLPRWKDAHPYLQGRCPGIKCQSARSAGVVNINCLMGLCKQCCVHAQATVPGLRSCTVGDHNSGRRCGPGINFAPAVVPAPLSIPGWTPPPPPGHPPAPASGSTPGPPTTPPRVGAAPVTSSTPTAASQAASRPSVPLTAIDPALLDPANLPALDSTQVTQAQDASNEARFTQEAAHTKPLEIWTEGCDCADVWVAQNGQVSQGYTVRIPHWPGFHPKDCPELVEAYQLDQKTCQYWDEERSRWWNCAPNTPSRNVRPLKVLKYRLLGVTYGVDMPGLVYDISEGSSRALGKRPASDSIDDDTSNESHFLKPGSVLARAYAQPRLPGSESVATPPHRLKFPGDYTLRRAALYDTDSDSRPRSPSQPTTGSLPPTSSASSTFDPTTIDLSNAPRGPNGWPFRYVRDMAAGFFLMRHLEDNAQMQRQPAFAEAFGVPYKKSTFHQNYNAWNDAGQVPGEHERWIAFGRDPRGEWARFYQAWRRPRS